MGILQLILLIVPFRSHSFPRGVRDLPAERCRCVIVVGAALPRQPADAGPSTASRHPPPAAVTHNIVSRVTLLCVVGNWFRVYAATQCIAQWICSHSILSIVCLFDNLGSFETYESYILHYIVWITYSTTLYLNILNRVSLFHLFQVKFKT